MAEDSESGWVMTWGFFGGRRPKRSPPTAAPVPPEGVKPVKKRPTKAIQKEPAQGMPVQRTRRGMPTMLTGLASSVRAFRAPGTTVLPTDGLAAHYSEMGSNNANPRVREGAMLFAVAEQCIDSDGDHARAVQAASAALSIFQEVGDLHAEADALRLVMHAQRLKAAAFRDAGDEVNLVKAERSASSFVQRMLGTFRAAGKKRSLAAMLLAVAELNFEKRSGTHESRHLEVEQAMQFVKEAQGILRDVKDKRLEAVSLVAICMMSLRSNPGTAKRAAQAALSLFKAVDDDHGEAKAYHALAHACFRDGSVQEGLEAAKDAKLRFQALDEDMAAALVSFSTAQRLLAVRRPGEAVAWAEQAFAALQELDAEKGWMAAAEALVVEALITGGEIAGGVARAQAAVARYAEGELLADKALALDAAARAQLAAGDKDKALEHAEAALQACRDLGADRAWEAGALHLVAQVQISRGEFGKAAVMASGAWRLFGRVGDDANQAKAMLTEAEADNQGGDYYDASETAQDALILAKELGDKVTEASALTAAAQAHLFRDEGEEALSTAKEALTLFQGDADGKFGEAQAFRLVAQVHMMNGDYDQASVPARQAMSLLREFGDAKAELEMLKITASLAIFRKRNEEAVRAAQDAFALGKQLGWDTRQEAEANILVCQAMFARMCTDAEAAKDSYQIVSRNEARVLRPAEDAARLAKQDGDRVLTAFALYTLASVTKYLYICLGKSEKLDGVLDTCREASKIFKELGDDSGQGNVALVMAEVHLACGRVKEAQDMVQQATSFGKASGDQELMTRAQELFSRGVPQQQQQQQMAMPQITQQAVVPEAKPTEAPEAAGSEAVSAKPKGLDYGVVAEMVKRVALEAVGDTDDIEMDVALMESGLDSLGAITFRNKLQQETGLKLAGTLMFDYPTMASVADHMVQLSLQQ
eukprot:CAMPEP_0175684488 /NCGR_PEP_ID=MMETSP0097-20121207/26866_1 /TAXON_ID=311494 /ORGANISM="Alexandrium monilatum, Strain CCMP3105" /LENGTH=933 /DNA_ID=CAMNT_0016991425 /DNA_START=6 /DNA_END=2807 /DNA_ORIENTATION=+